MFRKGCTFARDTQLAVFGGFTIYNIWSLDAMITLRKRLKLDFQGEVVESISSDGQRIEVLPNSGLTWTADGVPSVDRRIRGELGTCLKHRQKQELPDSAFAMN